MDEKTLEDALKQAEILESKKGEAVGTLEKVKEQAKVWKKELYELKKKYDLAVKTIATLEGALNGGGETIPVKSETETPVDGTEKEEVGNAPELDETPTESDMDGKTNEVKEVETEDVAEVSEKEENVSKKPRTRAKKAPKKEIVENTVNLTDDELDVDDVFGHDLDDEINNIEF